MANPWMDFLKKHRDLNPTMSPIEAAKSASKIYKMAKKTPLGKTIRKSMGVKGKKRRGYKGTQRRR